MANHTQARTDDVLWRNQEIFNQKLNSNLDEIQEMMNAMMDMLQGLNKLSSSQVLQSLSSVPYGSSFLRSLEAGIPVADGDGQPSPLELEGPKAAHNLFDKMPQLTSADGNEGKPNRFPTVVPDNDGIDIMGTIDWVGDEFAMYLKSSEQQLKVLDPWIESETKHSFVEETLSQLMVEAIQVPCDDDDSTGEGIVIKQAVWAQHELEPSPIYESVDDGLRGEVCCYEETAKRLAICSAKAWVEEITSGLKVILGQYVLVKDALEVFDEMTKKISAVVMVEQNSYFPYSIAYEEWGIKKWSSVAKLYDKMQICHGLDASGDVMFLFDPGGSSCLLRNWNWADNLSPNRGGPSDNGWKIVLLSVSSISRCKNGVNFQIYGGLDPSNSPKYGHLKQLREVLLSIERIFTYGDVNTTDLGCHEMGIHVGKLSLYTALRAIHHSACFLVTIDVGTNSGEAYTRRAGRAISASGNLCAPVELNGKVFELWGTGPIIEFEDKDINKDVEWTALKCFLTMGKNPLFAQLDLSKQLKESMDVGFNVSHERGFPIHKASSTETVCSVRMGVLGSENVSTPRNLLLASLYEMFGVYIVATRMILIIMNHSLESSIYYCEDIIKATVVGQPPQNFKWTDNFILAGEVTTTERQLPWVGYVTALNRGEGGVDFDDKSTEVVIPLLRFGDNHERLFINRSWFVFKDNAAGDGLEILQYFLVAITTFVLGKLKRYVWDPGLDESHWWAKMFYKLRWLIYLIGIGVVEVLISAVPYFSERTSGDRVQVGVMEFEGTPLWLDREVDIPSWGSLCGCALLNDDDDAALMVYKESGVPSMKDTYAALSIILFKQQRGQKATKCWNHLENFVWFPGLYVSRVFFILEDKDVLKGKDLSGSKGSEGISYFVFIY